MTTRRNTSKRGYGAAHQQLRKQVAQLVAAGGAYCWRCGKPIQPWQSWDLGHDDNDRSLYRGPEHAKCNRSSAASRGNRMRGKQPKVVRRKVANTSREW
jgi:hypothetical protein